MDIADIQLFEDRSADELAARLVAILRSEAPLDRHVRAGIADLFDAKATSRFAAKLKERKGSRPRKRRNYVRERAIWRVVNEAKKRESGVQQAMEIWRISRASVFAVLREVEGESKLLDKLGKRAVETTLRLQQSKKVR